MIQGTRRELRAARREGRVMGSKGSGHHAAQRARTALLAVAVPAAAAVGIALLAGGAGGSPAPATAGLRLTGAVVRAIPPTPRPTPAPTSRANPTPPADQTPAPPAGPTAPPAPATP
jgi:hypothetical protein